MPQFDVRVKQVTAKEKVVKTTDPETKQEYYETIRIGELKVSFDCDDLDGDEYKELVSMITDHDMRLAISQRGGGLG